MEFELLLIRFFKILCVLVISGQFVSSWASPVPDKHHLHLLNTLQYYSVAFQLFPSPIPPIPVSHIVYDCYAPIFETVDGWTQFWVNRVIWPEGMATGDQEMMVRFVLVLILVFWIVISLGYYNRQILLDFIVMSIDIKWTEE